MIFRRGQKVVYVGPDHRVTAAHFGFIAPVPNRVYTIHSGPELKLPFGHVDVPRVSAYALVELDNLHVAANLLRPVVEPRQDISFTEGAPLDSKKWDNRRKVKKRVRAWHYDLTEINRCLQELQRYTYKRAEPK